MTIKRRPTRYPLWVGLLGLTVLPVQAANSTEWRFWDVEDGLSQSFVAAISRDPTGAIWATHGDIRSISRFDGRKAAAIPSPYSNNGRRFDTLDGINGWVAEEDGLRHLQDGKWEIFPEFKMSALTPALQHIPDFHVLDLGNSQALLLFSNHVARFSLPSKHLDQLPFPPPQSGIGRLSTFERAPDGSVWVVGEKGAARFSYGPAAEGPYSWHEYPMGDLPIEKPAFPVACADGEMFLTAFRRGSQDRVIVRLWKGNWEIITGIPQARNASLAWRDGRGDLWLASGLLYRKSATNPEAGWVEIDSQNAVLSGTVHSVVVNPDGSFFLGTAFGLALHINLAWKTLTNATDSSGKRIQLRQHMNAMISDRHERLWILGEHSLLRFYHESWEEYRLPREFVTDTNQRNSMGEMSDGRILIQLQETPYLIAFDPESLRFSAIKLIAGYTPITFCRRTDGGFLVAMAGDGDLSDAVATLDQAGSLSQVTPIGGKWNVHYPKGMIETMTGQVWVGGTSGLVRFARGRAQRFDWIERPEHGNGEPRSKIPLQVFSMLPDGNEGILIGGRQLLCRWTGERLEFISDFPLVNNLWRSRDGALWAGTQIDVRRIPRSAKSGEIDLSGSWNPNGILDGLPMNAGNTVLADPSGNIWAITDRGPAVFRPDTDQDPPAAVIRADQNSAEAAPSGDFRAVFAGRDKWDLTPPDALLFSYRLDRGSWSSPAGNTLVSFHGLPEGGHIFEVVALDRQGNVSVTPARMEFSVDVMWYETPAFLILAFAASSTIIYLLCLAIYHFKKQKKSILIERSRTRILELVNSPAPLERLIEVLNKLIGEQLPDAFSCIHLCAGRDSLELASGHSLPAELALAFAQIPVGNEGTLPGRAAYARAVLHEDRPQRAWAFPIVSGRHELLGVVTLILPRSSAASPVQLLEMCSYLAAVAIEHRKLHDDLVHGSHYDQLTGLPNRALLDSRMDEALRSARLDNSAIAVGFIDLDGFKQINDRMGHEIGDLYLRRAAECFRKCLPISGTLARIGGDEFVFMLPGIGEEEELREIGRRLIDSISQPFRFGSLEAVASCSIGVAVFSQDGDDADELRRRADEAMYLAKKNGKGQVFLYKDCIQRNRRRSTTTSPCALESAIKAIN